MNQKYIVLDIDRTIINGTSWFYACTYPDLLISSINQSSFIEINNSLYTINKPAFRNRVFELLDEKITPAFLDIDYDYLSGKFNCGDFVDDQKFFYAGQYTIKHLLKTNDFWWRVVKIYEKIYKNSISLIYLTSGFRPFMEGVVKELHSRTNINIPYKVIGTEINFIKGKAYIVDRFFDQHAKYEYIVEAQKKGIDIVFLADDSMEQPLLFDAVHKKGGVAYNVKFDSKTRESNWEKFYTNFISSGMLSSVLSKKSPVALCDSIPDYPFLQYICKRINQIGIFYMDSESVKYLEYISLINSKLYEVLRSITIAVNKRIFFRNSIFYYWLPAYLNMNIELYHKRWENLFVTGFEILDNVEKIENQLYKIITAYIAIDHLLEALYQAQYFLGTKNEKAGHKLTSFDLIQRLIQECNDFMWYLFTGVFNKTLYYSILDHVHSVDINDFKEIHLLKKYMRELDNNVSIFCSAYNIAREIISRQIKYDFVISFAFGGIALGNALISVLKYLQYPYIPKVLISSYSSKMREDTKQETSLLGLIFPQFAVYTELIQRGNCMILLYDNNATTFSTLANAKQELCDKGNKVDCAVVEVNYSNMVSWLHKKQSCEEISPFWDNILTYPPFGEYVTAYNTWGSSTKTQILHDIFINQNKNYNFPSLRVNHHEVRKICRVHNRYDLAVAQIAGATMIGIHAVAWDKAKYFEHEINKAHFQKYMDINLPLPNFEIDGIKEMISRLPDSVFPVLVFENVVDAEALSSICSLLALEPEKSGVQLQFKADRNYIDIVKRQKFKTIIYAIGLFQTDIDSYLSVITSRIDKDDYILLDLSKHQPNYICSPDSKLVQFDSKENALKKVSSILRNYKHRLLLADDTSPESMHHYISILADCGINVAGIDMQNSVEIPPEEQVYINIENSSSPFEIKIRKSVPKATQWSDFYIENTGSWRRSSND